MLLCYSPTYLAPIRVTASPTNMDVLEGDPVEIEIGYRGNPKPAVTWYHNNVELVAPATQDSDPVALMGSHSLVLNVVMETNGGTYRAELVNSYGSDIVTVSLNVSGEGCARVCVVCGVVCGVVCVVCGVWCGVWCMRVYACAHVVCVVYACGCVCTCGVWCVWCGVRAYVRVCVCVCVCYDLLGQYMELFTALGG